MRNQIYIKTVWAFNTIILADFNRVIFFLSISLLQFTVVNLVLHYHCHPLSDPGLNKLFFSAYKGLFAKPVLHSDRSKKQSTHSNTGAGDNTMFASPHLIILIVKYKQLHLLLLFRNESIYSNSSSLHYTK